MIEAALLYVLSTLLFAVVAMLGCFIYRPPKFPVAARQRVLLFLCVWGIVTALKLALDLGFGPVNVLIPIAIAALGARLLVAKFSK